MKGIEINKPQVAIIIVSLLLIGMVFGYFASSLGLIKLDNSDDETNLMKLILNTDAYYRDINPLKASAESYYAEASYSYQLQDYNGVESNCRFARDYYSLEAQKLREAKAYLTSSDYSSEKIVSLYIEAINLNIEISNNMFEACEHFETASRYYTIYYKPETAYDDMSFDMAGGEIGMMNEKIEEHDKNVNLYNDKLAEYNLELKKRFEVD